MPPSDASNFLKPLQEIGDLARQSASLREKSAESHRLMTEFDNEFAAQRDRVLRVLPEKMGYDSVNAMIADLVRVHANGKLVADPKPFPPQGPQVREKRRPQHDLTPKIRQKVIALVNQGKTEFNIAEEIGISRASVSRIKKDGRPARQRRAKQGAS